MELREMYNHLKNLAHKKHLSIEDANLLKNLKEQNDAKLKIAQDYFEYHSEYADQVSKKRKAFREEQSSILSSITKKVLLAIVLITISLFSNLWFLAIPSFILTLHNLKSLNQLASKEEYERHDTEYDIAMFNTMISYYRCIIAVNFDEVINYFQNIIEENHQSELTPNNVKELTECFDYLETQFAELKQTNDAGPQGLSATLSFRIKNR